MKRESMMKKSMNNVLRVALVGVMALVYGLAGLVTSAEAAVTILSTPTTSVTEASAILTFSHTNPGGTDAMIIVGVGWDGRNGETLSGVTYAGQALTCSPLYGISTWRGNSAICYRLAPATGTYDVIVTMSANGGKPVIAGAVVVAGAEQVAPVVIGTGGSSADATLTPITSVATDMVIGVVNGYKNTTAVAPSGATEVWEDGVSGTNIANMAYSMGANSLTWTDATTPSGNQWGIGALVISEAVSDVTPPTNLGGVTAANTEFTTFVDANFDLSMIFDEPESTPTCEYTADGSVWNAATVTGTGPSYTCTQAIIGASGNLTLNMRASSVGGGPTTGISISRTVDATAPTTTDNYPGGTVTTDQNLTLITNDGVGSGVASTAWCVDTVNACTPGVDGDSFGTGTAVSVTGAACSVDTKYLRYASTDNVTNVETTKSTTVIIDKTDIDLATLTAGTNPAATATGTTTIFATVGVEGAPETLTNVQAVVTGSTVCDGTLPMTWSVGNSRWEASWNTATCGNPVESGVTIDVSGVDPDCNDAVAAAQISVGIDNTCAEVGLVTVSITPDPDPADITGAVTVNATLGGGATNGQVRWRNDAGGWSAWSPTGSTYSPATKSYGTVEFEAMADGSCGAGSPIYSVSITRNYDTRVDAIEPVNQTAVQSGLTAITATMLYCNDKNGTGQFQVDYRVSPAGGWTIGTPVTDGGAGDQDGTKNEQVVIILSGLVSGTTYDVRLTYIDATDGVIGTAVYTIEVPLVAWVDNAMLHNSNRFPGTVKHGGDWGTTTGYAGGIMCSTCHEKNPASGNIKRIKATISFPDSSTMPGGGTSAAVIFSSAVDGTSDFGDDSAAPRASSNRVCEVCHNFDGTADVVARINGTLVHAADQSVVSNHYDNADCMKCHEHKGGFKASCDSCHASPPINNATDLVKDGSSPGDATGSVTVGKHVKHANDLSFACNTCHTGWENAGEMPKSGQINVGFVTSGGNGGTYNGRTGGGGYLAEAGTTVNTNDALTCAVYCHGYGSPQWADAGTAVCGACHGQTGSAYGDNRDAAPDGSAGLGGRDLSNLLTGFKVGKHANHLDNSIAETGDPCALCHFGTLYPDTTHVDGTVDVQLRQAAVTGDNSTGGAGVSAIFTPGGPGTCSSMECHADADWDSAATGGCTMCHDYPPNAGGNHAAGVNPVNHDMFSATGVVDNHDSCTYCHGYKGVTDVLTPLTVVEITALKGDTSIQPSLAGYHNDGLVTMNDDLNAIAGDDSGYNATNAGCDTAACHANDASHRFNGGASTGNSIQQTDIGPGSCATCHDTGSGSAPVVTSGSSHVKVTAAGSYGDCTDCHSGHYAAAGGVQIVNNAAVGISYTQLGHGGIKLGGPGTNALISGKTTEAEICWACHTADGISEFGLNTDTNGTSANYNYGTLSANAVSAGGWYSNVGVGTEAGATWTSAVGEFLYKEGAIQSTHAANDAGTSATTGSNYAKTESLDAVSDVRCSYCHDVHDLNRLASDTSSGKPWLRGTWNGNPYKEDGAPRHLMSGWTNTPEEHNDVPRASAEPTNRMGGFWIDQNTTTNPAAQGWTANSSSGLCAVCHGSDGNATWTTTEIGNIDVAGENNWVSGQNGHANVVINGGGRGADASAESYARNIFTRAKRGSDWLFNDQENKDNPYVDMGVSTENNRGFSYRGTHSDSLTLSPGVLLSDDQPYTYRGFQWNNTQGSINIVSGTMALDVGNGGTGTSSIYDTLTCADPSINSGADDCTEPANYDAQATYHKFNCGKCHNPHASRLPKLMITNCLDTKQNDWDENNTSQYTDSLMGDATAGETTAWNNTYASQWASAQNCHRLDNRANASQTTTRGAGWNTVTPW